MLDEEHDRHYLLTAYHLVAGAESIEVKGADPVLSLSLHEIVQEVAYLPALDLAVYPCDEGCQAKLGDRVRARQPIRILMHRSDWPAQATQLSAIGNPRVQVAGRPALLPVNVAVGATVHGHAHLMDITGRDEYGAIEQPFLILSDFAIQPGFSGGPLVFSPTNFCDSFELAGVVVGGDPTGSNLSWAVPVTPLLAAIRSTEYRSLTQPQPPKLIPDTLAYAEAEPFLELVTWAPRIDPQVDKEQDSSVPTLHLTQEELTPISVTLRLSSQYKQLVPTLRGAPDLRIKSSAKIQDLTSSQPGLFQFEWQVIPLADPARLHKTQSLMINFHSEKGRTGLHLPLSYVVGPPSQSVGAALVKECLLVIDPVLRIYCPGIPDQALAGLNGQLAQRESSFQERLDEAQHWRDRYIRVTGELAQLGVDDATLKHLQELLDAGAFAQVRERIDKLESDLVVKQARLASLRGQSHVLEAFDYEAALPDLERAWELQPKTLEYALDYANALAELFRYEEAVTVYREILAWEDLETSESARISLQLGNALQGLGDYSGAVSSYDLAIAVMEGLREELGERWPAGMANDLAAAYTNRGTAYGQGLKDYASSVLSFDLAIAVREGLRERLGEQWTAGMANDLARAYMNRGNAQQGLKDYTGAVLWYDLAIAVMEGLREELGERWPADMANDLARAYVNRGTAQQGFEDYTGSVSSYDLAIAVMEGLREELGERWPAGMANDLTIAYMNRGTAQQGLEDYASSVSSYNLAIAVMEGLREELGERWSAGMANNLAQAYMNRGNALAQGLGDYSGAVSSYDLAIAVMEGLREELGERWPAGMANDLARAYMNLGNAQLDLENYSGSMCSYDQAIDLMEGLREELGERWSASMANDLAAGYMNRGRLHWREDEAREAQADYQLASDFALSTARETGNLQALEIFLNAATATLFIRSEAPSLLVPTAAEATKKTVTELIELRSTDRWPRRLREKLQLLLDFCEALMRQGVAP